MKKIKHLLLLFVLLAGAMGVANAQDPLSFTPTVLIHPSCAVIPSAPGDGSRFTVHVKGGVKPYTVTIDAGTPVTLSPPQDSIFTFNNFSAGSHAISVTDSDPMGVVTRTGSVYLSSLDYPPLRVSGVETQPTCASPSSGAIRLTVSGGTSTPGSGHGSAQGYNYAWSNGTTGANATGLKAGEYTVTVSDRNCVAVAPVVMTFVLATEDFPPLKIATSAITHPTCANLLAGSITLGAVSGGSGNYTYISPNGTSSTSAPAVIYNLRAGTYTYTIIDDCADVAPLEVTYTLAPIDVLPLKVSGVATQPTCLNNDGSIALTVSGGIGPSYAYAWSNGTTGSNPTGLKAGEYTVTVSDANCPAVEPVVLTYTLASTDYPALDVSGVATQPTCLNNDGSIALTVSGGTNTTYTYKWSNGYTGSNPTGLEAGEYTVTVSDATCPAVAPVVIPYTLSAAEYPALKVSVVKTNPDCGNESGSVTITVTGGSGTNTIMFNNAAATSGTAINNLAAGTYNLDVIDTGCEAILPVNMPVTLDKEENTIKIELIEVVNPTCPTESDGRIVIGVSGGNGTYTYTWTATSGSGLAAGARNQSTLTAGTYNVTVTASGSTCSAELTDIILVDPVIIDAADYVKTADLRVSNGQSVQTINLLSNPLPEGYVIEWEEDPLADVSTIGLAATSGGGEIQGFEATYKESGFNTAVIKYTVSHIGGCTVASYQGSFNITVYPLTVEDLGLSLNQLANPAALCFEDAAFANIDLAPVHATEALNTSEVSYLVEYVSGVQVIDITNVPAKGDLAWVATVSGISGTGVYSITPIWNNGLGIPSIVTFTVQPELLITDMDLNDVPLTYQNGEQVAAIVLNGGSLPEGANVVWEITGISDSGDGIGTGIVGTTGTNLIPAFTAVNTYENATEVTVEYTFHIEYEGCVSVSTGTFEMVVKPKKIGDMNLLVHQVIDITKCYEDALGTLTFTSEKSNEVGYTGATTTYKVEFVSGVPVLALNAGNSTATAAAWTLPQANPKVSGTGVYRVTPTYNSFEGKSTTFNVTVRPQLLVSDVSLYAQTMTVENGDMINEIDFTANIPAGAKVVWTNVGQNIGSAMAGENVIPQFRAYNSTMGSAATFVAEYEFSIKYAECNSLTVGKFTIVVEPKDIEDPNLVANPVSSQTICFADAFDAINFTAEKDNAKSALDAAKVEYVVEFVSGTQVIDLTNPNQISLGGAWTPVKLANAVGTGTYRVTPTYDAGNGLSALFTLTVQPELKVENLHMNGQVLTYQNGDMVDAIVLTGSIPEGAIVNWNQIALVDENGNDAAATYGINSIGSVAGGQNVVPAFTATNTLNATIAPFTLIATYSLDITYKGCVSNVGQFQIKVEANTIGDLDLVMKPVISQIECDGLAFDEVAFEAYRTDGQPFVGVGVVEYIVEFVDGVDVLNLGSSYIERGNAGDPAMWQPQLPAAADQVSGKGRYRVTPRWNNNEGKSAIFTLTFYKAFDNNDINIGDLFYVNREDVKQFELSAPSLPEGAKIVWQKVSGDFVGLDLDKGIDIIPAFTAFNENMSGANTVANYEAWVEYPDCNPASPITKKFSIIVRAGLAFDKALELSADLSNQIVCYDEPFENILLSANYRFPMDWDTQNIQKGDLMFVWKKIDGDNIIDPLAADGNLYVPVGTGSFSATWDLSAATKQTVGSGTYEVTPYWANRYGEPLTVTLTRLERATVDQVEDYFLCNNSSIEETFVSELTGVKLYWEVVDAAGNAISSQLGIPAFGTDKIAVAKLVNASATHITEYIKVTPTFTTQGNSGQAAPCPGIPMTFAITVLPTPVANQLPNVVYQYGDVTPVIPFTGVATSYVWEITDPNIVSYGASASGEGLEFPSFTVSNNVGKLLNSKVKVTPIYQFGNSEPCPGKTMEFEILVANKPVIALIEDQMVCEDQMTQLVEAKGLTEGPEYYISWTGAAAIGLADHEDPNGDPMTDRKRSILPFMIPSDLAVTGIDENIPTYVPVTVVPWVAIPGNNIAYKGDPVTFNYIVVPKVRLAAGYEQGVVIADFCSDEGNDIVMQVAVTGYDLKYQWYKDGKIIDNDDARKATYTIKGHHVDASTVGTYYVVVAGHCNTVTSGDFIVRAAIVVQNFSNVMTLYTDSTLNGGINFAPGTKFTWYELTAAGNSILIPNQEKSYLYMGEGNIFTPGSRYYVVAKLVDGSTYTSCPIEGKEAPAFTISVVPNPVGVGETVTVKIEGIATPNGKVEMYGTSGSLIKTQALISADTQLTMENDPGIYLIRVTVNDDGNGNQSTKEFKVIVK